MSDAGVKNETKMTMALRDVFNRAAVPVFTVLVGVTDRGVGIEVKDMEGRVADILLDVEHGQLVLYGWRQPDLDEDPTFEMMLHDKRRQVNDNNG